MIVLADDDIDDLEFVQEALCINNYKGRIMLATDGQKLMDQLYQRSEKEKPDLIVLDLNMPLKNGFQALQEIRTNQSLKSIPVCIVTASTSKQDEMRCVELGCNLFWKKPTSIDGYNSLAMVILDFLNSKVS